MSRLSPGALFLLAAVAATCACAGNAEPRRWTPPGIASDQYESTPAFTPDGREMYFMLSDTRFQNYRVVWSRCEAGHWTAPRPAAFAAPPPVLEADPFLTPDGKRLYFVSARRDPTGADLDIWYVDREPGGRWGRPLRMPEPVNSQGAELLPRATADGRVYFGSDRAGGHGLSDIYVTVPRGDGSWTVSNLGPPVSSSANEYEADISRDGRTLILVADRGDRSHLYRFVLQDGRWMERDRIAARADVFQVGPLLSPRADRLLFAQADGERSGELFVVDLSPDASRAWPPDCAAMR